jgi:hypothetical protein
MYWIYIELFYCKKWDKEKSNQSKWNLKVQQGHQNRLLIFGQVQVMSTYAFEPKKCQNK